jgi:hypothetical protein
MSEIFGKAPMEVYLSRFQIGETIYAAGIITIRKQRLLVCRRMTRGGWRTIETRDVPAEITNHVLFKKRFLRVATLREAHLLIYGR